MEMADAGRTPPLKSDRLIDLENRLGDAFDSMGETTESLKEAEKARSAALKELRKTQKDFELISRIGSDEQIEAARSRVTQAEVGFADATDDVIADRTRWERLRKAINDIRSQIQEEQVVIDLIEMRRPFSPTDRNSAARSSPKTPPTLTPEAEAALTAMESQTGIGGKVLKTVKVGGKIVVYIGIGAAVYEVAVDVIEGRPVVESVIYRAAAQPLAWPVDFWNRMVYESRRDKDEKIESAKKRRVWVRECVFQKLLEQGRLGLGDLTQKERNQYERECRLEFIRREGLKNADPRLKNLKPDQSESFPRYQFYVPPSRSTLSDK